MPADSRTGRFEIDKINPYKKKKRGNLVPVTRPATQGLRIAQLASTSNAEIAHADMYNDKVHL